MFSLKNFIKNGLIKAVGNMADYQVILNAAGWLEKGVLDENDLADIQVAIDAKNAPPETVEPEEPTETVEPDQTDEPDQIEETDQTDETETSAEVE